MATILDAYHQFRMQFGPAKVLYSTLRKQSSRQMALNLECARVDSTLRRSRLEMASYVIYFT
eukprot:7244344-Pyramimonas_sp.AAC.1